MSMVEKVAKAISDVQLFSRYNDWTSDRVEGMPIEICRRGDSSEEDIVVNRFGKEVDESDALYEVVREARARAAIEAMRYIEPSEEVMSALWSMRMSNTKESFALCWQAMIDAALKEEVR